MASVSILAQQLCIAPDQRQEFEKLFAQYQDTVRPEGAIQQTLFDELVCSAWNLGRIRRRESELLTGDLSDLDRVARHKTRLERTFHRSLRELKSLQTNAAFALTLPRFFTELAPPLACAAKIAKRTQALSFDEDTPIEDQYQTLKTIFYRREHGDECPDDPLPS